MARKLQNYSDIFARQKEQSLSSADLSRKGSIDSEIVNLVNYINASNRYFTTSSCSGRIIIYEENNGPKRGCRWFYTTHEQADFTQVMSSLSESEEDAVLKFEPFILHVQCCSLEDAKLMHEVAVASGYRNSGITLSNKGKIMTAIRSTHSLEVPLTHKGELLVDEKYILFLVELANKKVKENLARITRFFDNLKSATKARAEKGTSYSEKLKPNKATDNIAKQTPDNSSQIKEHLQDDPFLCVMDECTIDAETGLFSIIYSEDG